MIKDSQLVFSGTIASDNAATRAGQPITVDAISTNVIDLRQAETPAADAVGLWLVVIALTAAAGGDAAKTLTISLESDSTADLATSATTHFKSAAIRGSAITAGAVLARTKLASDDYERYLGLRYDVGGGVFTAFGVAAFLTPDVSQYAVHPSGITIDA